MRSPERADFQEDSHAAFFGDHAARYELASLYVRGKRVVDAACGSGYGSARLLQAGALSCTGIDIDAGSIENNRANYGPLGVEFFRADLEAEDLGPLAPEVVVSFETIEHVPHPEQFLARVSAALADDGVFIVSCPNNEKLGQNQFHLHSWDDAAFRGLLQRYFGSVVVLGQVETPTSRVHYEFGRYLDDRVSVMWNQPWTRAWRALRELMGRSPVTPRPLWANLVPGPQDWWFVPDTGPRAQMLVALCRAPRRRQ